MTVYRFVVVSPGATEAEAYAATADRAYDHMVDNLADRADRLRKIPRCQDGKMARGE